MESALSVALTSGSGIDSAGGSAMLSSLSSLNAASSDVSSGARSSRTVTRSFGEQQMLTTKLLSVTSQLGTAAASAMIAGTEQTLDGTDADGVGAQMMLAKLASISVDGVGVSGLSWGRQTRRLSSSPCQDIHIQQTKWSGTNPHSYADPARGQELPLSKGPLNGYVHANASVKILSMQACGEPVEYVKDGERRLVTTLSGDSPLELTLTMAAIPGVAEEGYGWDPVCAWFNESGAEWTADGTAFVGSANESGGGVTCQASIGISSMAYTAVWVEFLLPTTTTTTTRTPTTTSTTKTTTTTTSSWACDTAMLHSPYWRARWNCSWGLDTSTDNETGLALTRNYTCVAFCAAGSTLTTTAQCDGARWVVVEECLSSADSGGGDDDDESGFFGTGRALLFAAGGGFIAVLLCAACLVGGFLYYRYRQELEDREEPLVEHHVAWQEDEPAYAAARNIRPASYRPNHLRSAANPQPRRSEQDGNFWEWARHWASPHPFQVHGAEPSPPPAAEAAAPRPPRSR
ncbi:unnamed protein product [Prorocentrum cordatum]|uniref:Transmembrane protein n=1 Tax=Prorocentrum cordatum TaxID=2364126 RepID=A0ABN9Y505_9DINO|nr:unnamed protein product [Polarella glacialis]